MMPYSNWERFEPQDKTDIPELIDDYCHFIIKTNTIEMIRDRIYYIGPLASWLPEFCEMNWITYIHHNNLATKKVLIVAIAKHRMIPINAFTQFPRNTGFRNGLKWAYSLVRLLILWGESKTKKYKKDKQTNNLIRSNLIPAINLTEWMNERREQKKKNGKSKHHHYTIRNRLQIQY